MERTICSRRVFEGKILSVRVDTVVTPSGRTTTREIVERPEVVSVLPLDDEGKVVLVRQYRYAAGKEVLEIPAGVVGKGESAEEAARRELREETGYDATHLELLVSYRPAVGYSTERMTVFLGRGLVWAPERGDEENIKTERVPFDHLYDSLVRGNSPFEDAKSILAVLLARALGEA